MHVDQRRVGPAARHGLVDWALGQKREDPHTLAHLAAMNSSVWALKSYLDCAGTEIDENPE